MTITIPQSDRMSELVGLGYAVRQIHGDGVVDMAKRFDGDIVRVFVLPSGEIRPPRTHATMIAAAELHTAGIGTVSP